MFFEVSDNKISKSNVPSLKCTHEEADTRVVFHAKHISEMTAGSNVIVRANDTDILITLLHHVARLNCKLWMDTGSSAINTRRYIDVTTLGAMLGPSVCSALPALHAFTGCDYTAAFMRKGKVRLFEVMQKSTDFATAFGNIGKSRRVQQAVISKVERFVSTLYGKPSMSNVDETPLALFRQWNSPSTRGNPLHKLKRSDPALLPPCKTELVQKIKRTNYVASVWRNADTSSLPTR